MSAPALADSRRASAFPGSPRLTDLVNARGERWEMVRRRARPSYGQAWRAIALRYAVLVGGVTAHACLGAGAAWITAPMLALWVGFWLNSLFNFIHEGAHFNLHPDKRINDRLTNGVLCPLAGLEVAYYREYHWMHHLHLGSPRDTEVSYLRRPDLRFVLRALFGGAIIGVVQRRHRSAVRSAGRSGQIFGLLRTAAVHVLIVTGLLVAGCPATVAGWVIGAGMVYPLCNALRQTLEHRPTDAEAPPDGMGAVNRMFGSGLLARSFGSAGFNRHLLHHWDPSASYTTFDALEAFLCSTDLAPLIESARTTYWTTWCQLITRSRRAG